MLGKKDADWDDGDRVDNLKVSAVSARCDHRKEERGDRTCHSMGTTEVVRIMIPTMITVNRVSMIQKRFQRIGISTKIVLVTDSLIAAGIKRGMSAASLIKAVKQAAHLQSTSC